MEVFFARIRQLLPVLGSDLLILIAQPAAKQQSGGILFCRMKGAEGRGHRTPDGFVVLEGSTAVLRERQSAKRWPYIIALRNKLIADATLVQKDGFYHFTRDVEFSSPSAAAAVILGGSANGLVEWRTKDGRVLKELDEKRNTTTQPLGTIESAKRSRSAAFRSTNGQPGIASRLPKPVLGDFPSTTHG
jgi:hypothetical protein